MPSAVKTEEKIFLWGPAGCFEPEIVPPGQRDLEALRLFQSFLCNNETERTGLSNVIMLWEQIPKFSAEHLNDKSGIVPNDYKVDFTIAGHPFRLTLFPGTYYPKVCKSDPKRRFPGAREQAVEQALNHIACAQAETHEVNGETLYRVCFTTREVARTLKGMGSTLSHGQIREALEVLSSTTMTISSRSEDGIKHEARRPILPSFERTTTDSDMAVGKDVWSAHLHPLVSNAIRNVTYRQYPVAHTLGFAPFAAFLIRQMHYMAPNISTNHPFSFRLVALKEMTPGLHHKRLRDSIRAMIRELDKMKESGLLHDYQCEEVFPARRLNGRPAPIDAEFTLYPGKDWVKHVMAGSKRMLVAEKSLGLPRSRRSERQMNLPLL
ncbi:hypothetical protein E0E54_13780 [Azotobacter chroococcum]|uniref:Replication protein n=2 Tax=Azotobacter TaxID=352 RepID=A0A4R1P127_9GAMM|nr:MULTISPECIES: hypothetical protein [Azotobacter]ASL28919.1 hypothetical protein ACG10_21740 [Azotobacter chroococcum]QQE91116.1 hypothetical protein GKQ51_23255 [Azotobacter chroococcum]TBV91455.1 hypothetical protein E0E53_20780 [Azotobacter chroococcum]TBW34684.1 hypothetical protein E0E54_13780 [Azotobacter chroococcum]TCL15219.1 hypothetical protein EV691_1812 [Azotobacter chroococcum]